MRTPPHPPLPRWIGHRGAARHAPENTLAGIRRAAADGARWVEFDLRLTADEVPVLLHDDTLDRTTGASGLVRSLRWSELAAVDAGIRFGPEHRGEALPSLAQALACCAALRLGANLEFKADAGAEDALVTAVARVIRNSSVPMILSAFEHEALACAARRIPEQARGFLIGAPHDSAAATAAALGCASVHAAHDALDMHTAQLLRAQGASLLAYTVNDPKRARFLYDCGVTSVFTDDPAAYASAF